MRFLKPLLAMLLTGAVVFLLSRPLGPLPPLGTVLDPLNGAMAAAEPADKDFNQNLHLPGIQTAVEVWFEDRLVPHIRAANDHDLYYTQGYVHAYFRLWQMDMQTRAAAGRVAEVAGKKALAFDRGQRRKGMGHAAEQSLQAMESDPRTKAMLDAYRDGINAFIDQCSFRGLPIEYKLMNFRPEPWTNLRSALLLKYMADDLTGKTDDIAFTVLRQQLGEEQFNFLFPERISGSLPVIPEGTKWEPPSLPQPAIPSNPFSFQKDSSTAQIPASEFQIPAQHNPEFEVRNSESAIGSNNWAVSGRLTASGAPILCNDPHLGLNLPSLWYEVQLTAPGINVYGVSLPGAPGVVIGFNDSLSWGVTNNYRDVKDYFALKTPDADHYQFDGAPVAFTKRVEVIHCKDSADLVDTMRYSIHGPVQYDPSYPDPQATGKTLACCWMAQRPTNELLSLYLLNRAQNYDQYVAAIHHFECPAQNFVYADRAGNIAMWGQGRYINKWKGQGKFIMEGEDRRTLWGDTIPMRENPHVLNPEQGYVASANQITTDSTYPYWYNGGGFVYWRSWEINGYLSDLPNIALLRADVPRNEPARHYGESHVIDGPTKRVSMQAMQTDNYSILARTASQLISYYVTDYSYLEELHKSNISDSIEPQNASYVELRRNSFLATFYQIWWANFYDQIWRNRWKDGLYPSAERTIELLIGDSASAILDNPATSQHEDLRYYSNAAFQNARDSTRKLAATGLEWYKVKNTSLTHLARIKAFSYEQLPIGGWSNTINAAAGKWGPSWRMIVQMGRDSIEAWGVYPGGPSGNPGSRFYGDLVDAWVKGEYRRLLFLPAASSRPAAIHYVWKIST